MNDLLRLQVRKNDTEHTWKDVGNKVGDESVPVNNESLSSIDITLDEVKSNNSFGISTADYSFQPHFEEITDWVESAGADNLATSTDHRGPGTQSLEIDKINGNTTAMISKTIDAVDVEAYSLHAIGHVHMYLSDLTNVNYAFIRFGTDASNYWEWQFADSLLSSGWNDVDINLSEPTSQVGNGANLGSLTYIAIGIVFDNATDTLSDIRIGGLVFKRVLETSQIISSDVQVNAPFLVIKDQNSNTRLDVVGGATYNHLPVRQTDGTNVMPTGDADARAIYVNLGANNDVSLNTKAIIGAGDPTIDSYTHLPINLSAGNNQVLVSSAANKQIWVYGIGFTVNVAGSVSFQDEDDTAITGIMPFYANSGLGIPPSGNFAMPIWKLATNKDLEVDIVTCDMDGWLDYAIVSV